MGLKLQLLQGQHEDLYSNLRATLWRWRSNGGTWTLLETAFTSCFMQKVWVTGKSFLAISTFAWKELVHSLAKYFQTLVNKLNIQCKCFYFKLCKKHRGPQKCPCGPRVSDPCFRMCWPDCPLTTCVIAAIFEFTTFPVSVTGTLRYINITTHDCMRPLLLHTRSRCITGTQQGNLYSLSLWLLAIRCMVFNFTLLAAD